MSSTKHAPLSESSRQMLLKTARASIRHGLEDGHPLTVNADDAPPQLRAVRACFVTLHKQGQLRGCIGHLEARQPLIMDVADNAFSAAFQDHRFPPLQEDELGQLQVHISVLTPPEELAVASELDLLRQIEPGKDGLIIQDGPYRGTFLPTVWESLPEPRQFIAELKRKAGLPADYWSDTLQVERYRTESFGE